MVEQGVRKLDWIMPRLRVLNMLREEFEREKPLEGLAIGMCLHVELKTAGLLRVLQAGGAKVAVTGSPGTTQDDVAIALANTGISVYGCSRDKRTEHLENIRDVLRHQPQLLMAQWCGPHGHTDRGIFCQWSDRRNGRNYLGGQSPSE